MSETNLAIYSVDLRGVADIAANGGAVGDGCIRLPRSKRITERIHVRVGANVGIAKQIPGAADGVARLQNDVRFAGTISLQVISGIDARQSRADDDDVEVRHYGLAHSGRDLRD